jgi:hypothetical protein
MKAKTKREKHLLAVIADALPFLLNRDLIAHGSTPDPLHASQYQITRALAIEQARAALTP